MWQNKFGFLKFKMADFSLYRKYVILRKRMKSDIKNKYFYFTINKTDWCGFKKCWLPIIQNGWRFIISKIRNPTVSPKKTKQMKSDIKWVKTFRLRKIWHIGVVIKKWFLPKIQDGPLFIIWKVRNSSESVRKRNKSSIKLVNTFILP